MGAQWQRKPGKPLGVFQLVMINMIAVNSLGSLAFMAALGPWLLPIYLGLCLCFLMPIALVAAELASVWPMRGGIYAWVRQAFGPRWGFFIIWMQWIYNTFWYPSMTVFLASTFASACFPQWVDHPAALLPMAWLLFGVASLANAFGMRVSSLVSTLGTLLGTFVPMGCLVFLGAREVWAHGWSIPHTALPIWSGSQHTIAMILALMFGMVGIEMSGVHAQEVRSPKRAYPLAMLISVLLIAAGQIFSSMSIAALVPSAKLNLITGVTQAFQVLFHQHGHPMLGTLLVALILFGGLCGVSAWIIGPLKGIGQAVLDGCAPKALGKLSAHGVPVRLLWVQSAVFFCLSALYACLPSMQYAYEVLTMLTTQMALLVYVVMILAVWVARRDQRRERGDAPPFRIPGGQIGLSVVSLLGLGSCLAGFVIGFWPVGEQPWLQHVAHDMAILGVLLLVLGFPWWLSRHLR